MSKENENKPLEQPAVMPSLRIITANELRIDNLLFDKENRLCRVEEISIDKLYAPALHGPITTLPNKCINITEEWLLKLGFKELYKSDFTWKFENEKHTKIEVYLLPNIAFNVGGRCMALINYIHQLQNLYFALTGEELSLKTDESNGA